MNETFRRYRLPILLPLLVSGCIFCLLWQLAHQDALERYRQDQDRHARRAARQIAMTLNQLSLGLNAVVKELTDPAAIALSEHHLAILAAGYPPELLLSLYLLDPQGRVLTEVPPGHLARLDLPGQELLASDANRTELLLLGSKRLPLVHLQQQFSLTDGQRYDLSALVSLEQLCRMAFPDAADASVAALVFAKNGTLLFHPDPALIGAATRDLADPDRDPQLYETLERIVRGDAGGSSSVSRRQLRLAGDDDTESLLLVHAPVEVPGSRWGLALLTPQPAGGPGGGLLGIGLLMLLSGLSAAAVLHQRARTAEQGLGHATERLEQAQNQLDDAQRRSRQLLDYAGDALFFIDPASGRIVDQNQPALALLGYSAAELPVTSLSQIFPGNQRHKYMRLVKRVLKSGYAEEGGLLIRRKDGSEFTGAIHARLGTLDDRQIVHGVLRDISHLKQVERELRRRNRDLVLSNRIAFQTASSQDLHQMLEDALGLVMDAFGSASGGVYLSRHGGNLLELHVHRGIEQALLDELTSLPPRKGLVGRALVSGRPIASANLQKDRRVWSQAVKTSGWKGFQAVPLATSNNSFGVLFLAYPDKTVLENEDVQLLLALGQQLGTAIAGAELIEALSWQNRLTQASNRELKASRRQLAENLRRQREETRALERLEKMKNQFLALASHELRTPLTYILSGSELLLNTSLTVDPETRMKVLDAIHAGGTRLAEIVDNLLEMAKLEAQAIYLSQERVDLPELVGQLEERLAADLQNNRLSFEVGPFPELDDLFGDRDHLARALQRLIENAIKFTPGGGTISLTAERLADEEVRASRELLEPFCSHFFKRPLAFSYLLLKVRDTGIGIDRDEQTRIFDKFYEIGEIDQHFTSRVGFGGKGVGLGLALVKGMIEAHDGMIWVHSPGTARGGSCFHLLLPLRKPADAQLADSA